MWVYGYKMRLKIGACESRFGYLADNRDKWASLSSDEQVRLNDYLGGLLAIVGLDTVGLAIRYKIRRASVSDLLNRAVVGVNFEQEKAYWDTLVMKPIVECSGGLNRVTRGAVYFKKRRNLSVPNVKFPELKAIGCASFPVDLREYWKAGNPDVRCDTVLFGWFVNDTLRVAKYFYDERAFASQTKSTFEEYMIIGEWEKTTTVGLAGLVGSVYCTDFDDRREVSPTIEYTHLKGWDLGYGKPFYATPILFQQVGSVSRNRFFGYEEKIERTIGAKLDVGVCVPVYCRDALLYAMHDKFEQKNYSERVYREAIADPYSYQMWTYDHVFHWMGRTIAGNKGKPHPRDSKPVYVDSEIYKPSPVSDYANNGSWMQTVSDITPIVQPYMWENGERRNIGITFGGEPPPLKMYHHETKKENGGKGYLSVVMKHTDAKVVHKEMPNEWYFETSPDPLTLEYFYRDACFNTIGVLEYGNISETKKNSNKRFSWGKSRLFDDDKAKACFFIGVLNE